MVPSWLDLIFRLGSDGKSINWNDIAKIIPGRSNKDCRKRYFNEVTGGLKKVRDDSSTQRPCGLLIRLQGPWLEDEDVDWKAS